MHTLSIGIDKIGFYIPQYYVELGLIAARDGTNPSKYHRGLGQERFAVAPPDEDIVTMAANAAYPLLDATDLQHIDTVLLATETGIDQSKAAAIYVHRLLALRANCRAVELKQACYSATAGLQLAASYVRANPTRRVLLIASDISRYDLHTPAEATQGAAAVAMVIAANPRIATLDAPSGCYTADVMDFWRPNYRHTPLVDGKYSTEVYLEAVKHAYHAYHAQGGLNYAQFAQYCYHLPFNKMGQKAHEYLCKVNQIDNDIKKLEESMRYNRIIGNSYTASLYLSLCSALDHRDDLANTSVALASYGSGCVAEFFAMTILPSYLSQRQKAHHQALIAQRIALDYASYEQFWHRPELTQTDTLSVGQYNRSRYRFTGVFNHQRQYCINPDS